MHFNKVIKSIFLATVSLFVIAKSIPAVALSNNNKTSYYNTLLNSTNENDIPSIISENKTYSKKTFNLSHNLTITNNAKVILNNSKLNLGKDIIINNKKGDSNSTPLDIEFDNSVLTAKDANIYSGILFKDSILTFVNGHIDSLTVEGTADIAVKGTSFNTLKFSKNLLNIIV